MELESSYRLCRFVDPDDPEFIRALRLYSEYTHPSVRTNSNEITYWLSNYSRKFSDDFFLFGFYLNNRLVGFAQAVYFSAPQFLALDYLVIDPMNRGSNVFFEFVEHVRAYILRSGLEPRFAVAEVAHYSQNDEPHPESRLMIRLLKFAGFHVVRAPYYQPMLGLENFESKMRATLMLYSNEPASEISSATYIQILRTLYYDHYLRWYSMYDQVKDAYSSHIESMFAELRSWAETRSSIPMNGHSEIISLPPPAAAPQEADRASRFARWSMLWLFLSAALVFTLIKVFSASLTDVLWVVLFLLAVYVILMALVLERLQPLGEKILAMAVRVFGRKS